MKQIYVDRYSILKKISKMEKIIIELGPGNKRLFPNSITIDKIDLENVDIVTDINKGLSFLKDESVDEIHSYHFLEHVENLEFILKEIQRVLKKGGKKIGTVPHFSNPYFYSDYTHKVFFGLYSFSYFSKDKYFKRPLPSFYNNIDFKINSIKLKFKSPFIIRHCIKKFQQFIFNSSKYILEFYEENLSSLFPAYEIYFELEKK